MQIASDVNEQAVFLRQNSLNFVAAVNFANEPPFLTPICRTRRIQYMKLEQSLCEWVSYHTCKYQCNLEQDTTAIHLCPSPLPSFVYHHASWQAFKLPESLRDRHIAALDLDRPTTASIVAATLEPQESGRGANGNVIPLDGRNDAQWLGLYSYT